ncbi:sigma-54 interaction domain-containing protein [Alkaliphilus oremlandii]|uniref:PAS modulated sigma54 specific transcriptional regulator, Fis family n=1 Tax=Alkaliphilus oremlandii (strain OhILAs) TaxID=350688 RepID=A8MJG5_ALKOO|nr:sigma-54-dependent Fis family transcriptional regulator [Alkaliphilus oremlandii]ABW19947.1 PAS modulated sigma54 specific transcriptional regulator, Fis family [Alkaliphilus oremlandii OhILAs]
MKGRLDMLNEIDVILNSTQDATIAVDMKGIITLFNRAAEKIVKVKEKDALGKYIEDVLPSTRLPYILKTGESELNRRQVIADISIITSRMPVKDDKGNITGAVAVFRDISEILNLNDEIYKLKEMQSLLEGIFNSSQDAISVCNENGIGIMINPAYTDLIGLSEEDIIGKPATVDVVEGKSVHMRVLKTKKPVKGARLKIGPNKKEVVASAAPIIVDGDLKGSVGILHDLTEIRRLHNELMQAKQIIRKLEAKYTFDDIIGYDELMVTAIEKAKKAALTPATVLLRGESGTGKELFAHAIHNLSYRRYNQFVRVNCAAINENILESELFGYEEGAFTGALKGGKVGFFEQAHGGTIFLDEIGEISLSTQVKLLRVLQEKEIVRVGGTSPINIDVRVIAATNASLEKAIEEGKFREDLYYRLNVIPIQIPPLKKRLSDFHYLVLNLINKLNQEYGRHVENIDEEALERLKSYDWPGNVRELQNIIGRSIINMKINETVIKEEHLPKLLHSELKTNPEQHISYATEDRDNVKNLKETMEALEKQVIMDALNRNNGNRTATAKELQISIRNLYYKMEKYVIEE